LATEVILSLENVTAGYSPAIDILHNISFEIREGEIASIVGPNGAGKSTIFNVVFGFIKPKRGDVYFAGRKITDMDTRRRLTQGITYAPQGRCNFPLMSIRENLEMAAFTRTDDTVNKSIERLLLRYPILGERQDELAGNLSGGMQQILEMAMALMLRPKLILLDEPSLGLSPIMMDLVFQEIKKMNMEGVTLLLIEQNAKRALAISDHAVVLQLGNVALEGSGEEILNNEEVKRLYLGG
jgi:ABC-type branched-subunit amino acid transport system ATPase component